MKRVGCTGYKDGSQWTYLKKFSQSAIVKFCVCINEPKLIISNDNIMEVYDMVMVCKIHCPAGKRWSHKGIYVHQKAGNFWHVIHSSSSWASWKSLYPCLLLKENSELGREKILTILEWFPVFVFRPLCSDLFMRGSNVPPSKAFIATTSCVCTEIPSASSTAANRGDRSIGHEYNWTAQIMPFKHWKCCEPLLQNWAAAWMNYSFAQLPL